VMARCHPIAKTKSMAATMTSNGANRTRGLRDQEERVMAALPTSGAF
jgi:hypothetical protein